MESKVEMRKIFCDTLIDLAKAHLYRQLRFPTDLRYTGL